MPMSGDSQQAPFLPEGEQTMEIGSKSERRKWGLHKKMPRNGPAQINIEVVSYADNENSATEAHTMLDKICFKILRHS